jgi:hypothetical protein
MRDKLALLLVDWGLRLMSPRLARTYVREMARVYDRLPLFDRLMMG